VKVLVVVADVFLRMMIFLVFLQKLKRKNLKRMNQRMMNCLKKRRICEY